MSTSYKTPSYYKNTLKELNNKYYSVLDEMVKVFPKYKMYPTFQTYSKEYTEDMGIINKIQTEFFLFRNNLDSDNDTINKHLTARLNSLQNSNNASHGMLKDTKLLYNQKMAGNWLLFFVLTSVVYKYYK